MHRRVVLIVDDSLTASLAPRAALAARGYKAAPVASLAAARARLREGMRPAGAMLDHELPDGRGVELVDELRALGCLVVAIVTASDPDKLAPSSRRGVDLTSRKPIDVARFADLLDERLARYLASLR